MKHGWVTVLSLVALGLGLASALWIAFDIFGRGRRLRMKIMEAVWPITGLCLGPLGILAYRRWSTPRSAEPEQKPFWATVAVGVSHCSGGCTVGDIVGATMVFLLGFELARRSLWPELMVDFVLALAAGLAFQYFAIAPMRGLGLRAGVRAAAKADIASLTTYEIGMFGWMIVAQLVLFPGGLHPNEPTFWLMMQIGMVLGFVTAFPVNWYLIRHGVQEAM
jgi:hypothetical protein